MLLFLYLYRMWAKTRPCLASDLPNLIFFLNPNQSSLLFAQILPNQRQGRDRLLALLTSGGKHRTEVMWGEREEGLKGLELPDKVENTWYKTSGVNKALFLWGFKVES